MDDFIFILDRFYNYLTVLLGRFDNPTRHFGYNLFID